MPCNLCDGYKSRALCRCTFDKISIEFQKPRLYSDHPNKELRQYQLHRMKLCPQRLQGLSCFECKQVEGSENRRRELLRELMERE